MSFSSSSSSSSSSPLPPAPASPQSSPLLSPVMMRARRMSISNVKLPARFADGHSGQLEQTEARMFKRGSSGGSSKFTRSAADEHVMLDGVMTRVKELKGQKRIARRQPEMKGKLAALFRKEKAKDEFAYEFSNSSLAASLARYDQGVRRRNLAIFLIALSQIVTGIVMIETTWDHDTARDLPPGRWEFFLKSILLVQSLVLCLLLTEYYVHQSRNERKHWFIQDSALWHRRRWVFLIVELFFCIMHPPPLDFGGEERAYPNSIAFLMAPKFYLVIRVVRDYCPVYRARRSLAVTPHIRTMGSLAFNWASAVRFWFLNYMWTVTSLGALFLYGAFAYTVYVLERRVDSNWTIEHALWNMATTMTTVGYGDTVPSHPSSQAADAAAALAGILVAAIFTFLILNSLEYNPLEREAHNKMQLDWLLEEQAECAATYIQLTWRYYVYKRIMFSSDTPRNRALRYREFRNRNQDLKDRLQRFRREQTITVSPRHPGLSARFTYLDGQHARLNGVIHNLAGSVETLHSTTTARFLDIKQDLDAQVAAGARRSARAAEKVRERTIADIRKARTSLRAKCNVLMRRSGASGGRDDAARDVVREHKRETDRLRREAALRMRAAHDRQSTVLRKIEAWLEPHGQHALQELDEELFGK